MKLSHILTITQRDFSIFKEENMGFENTAMGSKFFLKDIPTLINSLKSIADSLSVIAQTNRDLQQIVLSQQEEINELKRKIN